MARVRHDPAPEKRVLRRMLHSVPLDHLIATGVVSFPPRGGSPGGIVVYADAAARAFVNRCPHWNLPLDHSGPLRTDEHGRLVCASHDARFRTDDGSCVAGPCEGQHLDLLEVEVDGGVVRVYTGPRLSVGVTAPWGAVGSEDER